MIVEFRLFDPKIFQIDGNNLTFVSFEIENFAEICLEIASVYRLTMCEGITLLRLHEKFRWEH